MIDQKCILLPEATVLVVLFLFSCWGAVTSWLVCLTPDRMVRDRALAGDIVEFFGEIFTLTVPLSTQVCKWAPTNLMLEGNPAMD